MTVLMQMELSNGKQMKCDSRCYNAVGPVCNCCCGGINHGNGFNSASEFWDKVSKQDPEALNELATVLEQSKVIGKEDVTKVLNFLTKGNL